MRVTHMRLRLWWLMVVVAVSAVVLALVRGLDLTRWRESGLVLMGYIWVMHAVVAAVLSTPIVFLGRKRVHWGPLDFMAFVLPFGVWLVLSEFSEPTGKSLANLIEPVYFSLAIPLAALFRVIVGARVREWACSTSLVALVCLTAACVFWLTPPLPE